LRVFAPASESKMRHITAHEVVVSEYVRSAIRAKAARLCRLPGFQRRDQEDLEQELVVHLLVRLQGFEPERSSINTFIDRVLDSAVRMELRRAHRLKRGQGRRLESLDADTPSGPLRDAVPQDVHSRRTGATSVDPREQRIDGDALQLALDSLPDNLRRLCERLMEIGKTRLAAELGISTRQVGNLIEQILPTLLRAGFGRNSNSRTERDETA
jgi:RNA polymerase sigma factor (sigma-70 family)